MKQTLLLLLLAALLLFATGQKPANHPGKGKVKSTPTSTPIPTSTPMLIANAGSDFSCFVGEPVLIDGSASTDYITVSQTDGTWSIRWDMGDGNDVQNMIKAPHAFMEAGVYTVTLTIKSAGGSSHSDTATVTVTDIPTATEGNTQTLTDTGNAATNKTNLQNAVNSAATNAATNRIIVPAGFTFNGPLDLPARTSTNYVTIEVANADTNLTRNTRVTTSNASNMFKLLANDPGTMGSHYTVRLIPTSQYYRIIGMNIERTMGSVALGDFIAVDFGAVSPDTAQANHIIIDRCILNGNDKPIGRAIAPNGRYWSILNSSILDIKSAGVETKGVGQWSGEGPLAVINNRIETAAINAIIGGVNAGLSSMVLKGYVFRGNYLWKDTAWYSGSWVVKNLWEMKVGHFAVCAGNIMENNREHAMWIKAATQGTDSDSGTPTYNTVSDLDIRNNKILNVRQAFAVTNLQDLHGGGIPPFLNHVRIINNLFTEWTDDDDRRGDFIFAPPYFELIHNTWIVTSGGDKNQWLVVDRGAGASGYQAPGLKILNNMGASSVFSAIRSGDFAGTAALNDLFTGWDFRNNYVPPWSGSHPTDNFYPGSYDTSNFTNYAGGDYSLASGSAYNNAATDGTDVGADMDVLNAATATATSGVWAVGGGSEPPTARSHKLSGKVRMSGGVRIS